MDDSAQPKSKRKGWLILGSLVAGFVLLTVIGAALLPIFIVQWLGGKDFQRLASQQVSSILQTEGEFASLDWSSFSVYSPGFTSRAGARGPWVWDLREIRTEISPRLLLDRILRFQEITIGSLALTPGTGAAIPAGPATPAPSASSGKSSSDLFRDVQIGTVEIKSFQLKPGPATSGWGAKEIRILVFPGSQNTDFDLQSGEIITSFPWIGTVSLQHAKGSYASPDLFLTQMELKSGQGGTIEASGEYHAVSPPSAKGHLSRKNWALPGGKIGVGLFEIPAKMSGDFELLDWKTGGAVGSGKIQLVDARLEPGKGAETILGLLAALTGESRLRGCALTTAQASWTLEPGIYDISSIEAEAPGLLRAEGQVRVVGENLSGQVNLGLDKNLGAKVSALTGGECFRTEKDGYLYQPIQISGTLDQPDNDLKKKLTDAMARNLVRTGAQILERAAGAQGGASGNDAAGQVLNGIRSLFGPAPKQ